MNASKQTRPLPADRASPGQRLSICLYTDTFFPSIGGAQTVLDRLASHLVAAGHRPLVFAPAPRERWDDSQYDYPVVRYRRPRSKRFGVRLILPQLARLHLRHRFSILHCHAAYPQAYVARTLRRLFGIPFVVRPHGADILPGEKIRESIRLERRMQTALSSADAVIAQGEYLREVIAEAGVHPRQIHVIHNGVDVGTFQTSQPFPHPRPYVLGLGNLIPHKGFDLLIRGYAELPYPRADLLIAGGGSEAAALQQLVQKLGATDRVHFLGPVTGQRKISLYRSAEFFVCPSRREPFANVILEALAAGLPVVATDVGGNREVVKHEVNGLLCAPESPTAIATALHRLLSIPSLLPQLRASTPSTIQPFDWPGVAAAYAGLYGEVIETQRRTMRELTTDRATA